MKLVLAALLVPALAAADPAPEGVAIGAEVGDPASVTAAWFTRTLDVALAIGSGTLAGPGFQSHVDVQLIVTRLPSNILVRAGLGTRVYNQHYTPQSRDEIPNWVYGVRAPITLAYQHGSMELYAELAPGVDLVRTTSCNLADGAMSICPHAQSKPVFLEFGIGARWFISH